MSYKVRVLGRAQQDVATCYAYIAQRSLQGAASWFNRFAETRDRLSRDPNRRPLAPESRFVDYEVRETLFKTRKGRPYRILFTISGDEALVLRVRGPGQDFLTADDLGGPADAE
jgi:plasmid stabilization system protein ParE